MSQPKSGYAYLKSQYFALCGAVRKQLAGNGRVTNNAAAEAIIAASTVRAEGKNSIYFKDSVEKLRAAYDALKPQEAVEA
jgi:hypothetical protein